MSTHEILILGGHHAGLNTAHYLLRHVLPKLTSATQKYHITIVTPNTEFFWNVAAPRLLVSSTLIPENKVFLPIAKEFASYDQTQIAFVNGKAVALDEGTKTVEISNGAKITYATLVIATGVSYVEPAWQATNSDAETKSSIASLRASLEKGKTVLIAGGGAIGVETAGEIGAQFPKHDTTILSGNTRLLPRLNASNSSAAESRLKAMGVKTIHGVKITSSTKNADGSSTVALDDGSSRTVDVYIDATGGKPNTTFLPKAWLNDTGRVTTNDKTLRTPIAGVYALGDACSSTGGSLVDTGACIAPVCTSIAIDLAKAAGKDGVFTQKEFKPLKDTQFVPTGPSGGVGQVMGFKVPSFMVWLAKSRTYFVSMAQGAVDGGNVKKP